MYNRPIRKVVKRKNLLNRGIPRQYVEAVLGDYEFDDTIEEAMYNYLTYLPEMFRDGASLFFFGANGTGKTWLSCLIVKEAYIRRFSSYRVTLQEILDMTFKKDKDDYYKQRLEDITTCEFLVIDEVGKEIFAQSQYNIIRLEEIMRQRDTLGYPTIICTNLRLTGEGSIEQLYGTSITSLIAGNFLQIKFDGHDNRADVLLEKPAIKKLIGED